MSRQIRRREERKAKAIECESPPEIPMYVMDQGEQEAILNVLILIREELATVLPANEVTLMDHSPYDVAMTAWKFIRNAKKMREQDLAIGEFDSIIEPITSNVEVEDEA